MDLCTCIYFINLSTIFIFFIKIDFVVLAVDQVHDSSILLYMYYVKNKIGCKITFCCL